MRESILIIRHITWRKVANAIIRSLSKAISKLTGRYANWGMPWAYSIEPCNICNLRCRECASGLGMLRRRRGMIDTGDYRHAVDQIAPYAIHLFLYFQGEPTLHPSFAAMARYASDKGVYTATSTNGHYLTPEACEEIVRSGLGKMIVSIDGHSQQSYEAYRTGGSLQKVLDGIRNLSEAKRRMRSSTPIIEAQTLVTRPNEKHLAEVRALAMEAGADLHCLKTMQIEKEEDMDTINTTLPRYSRYRQDHTLKNPVRFCKRMIESAVIDIDMNVLPCCYDKDSTMRLGNLKTSPLRDIIKSSEACRIVNLIEFQKDKRPDICRNCGG